MATSQDVLQPAAHYEPSFRRWVIAGVLLLVVISGFFDRISIAVLFTNRDFVTVIGTGFNPPLLGLLMTSFLFAYGASGVVLSFVGDIIGVRRSLGAASAIWGILMALIGATSSYSLMIFYRVLLGVAEGPQFSFVNKVIKQWFPPHEQGRANSIWMVGSPLGSAIGFPLTITLIAAYGWRASFYVLAAFNLVIMVPLILAFIQDRPQKQAVEPRVSETTSHSFRLDVKCFLSDWRFWLILIFNSACLLYLWGFNAWLPSYLEQVRHFQLKSLGLFASLPFVMMFFGELAGGYVSDRLNRRAAVCLIGLFCAGGLIYIVPMMSDPYLAAIVMALSAGFWGSALPPLFALAATIIPRSVTSTGVGVYNGVGNLVGACSPLLMGWIIGAAGNFNAGLMVLVLSGVIGACAMLPLLRRY